ncbi:hypothetical protein F5B20DRAFT_526603 [Whalleya microplaca]|nr:hypothetical protein F5B20DRAFT_526603 [Whalleya microplaca]
MLSSLHEDMEQMAGRFQSLCEDETALLVQLKASLIKEHLARAGDCRTKCSALLTYFDEAINRIAFDVLDLAEPVEHLEIIPLKIARTWYQEAARQGGRLDINRYFIVHEMETPGWPYYEDDAGQYDEHEENTFGWLYDKDFTSEHYDGHGGHLNPHQGYAENPHLRCGRSAADRQQHEENWMYLWGEILKQFPGPNLFDPWNSPRFMSLYCQPNNPPRYLFHVSDPKSPGRSDDDVVASPASLLGSLESKLDLLHLDKRSVASMLYAHLKPDYSMLESEHSDNLMSWTSSLLYAIVYAIYRRHMYGCSPSDIKICAVDATKFPRGQFMNVSTLLDLYSDGFKQCKSFMRSFPDKATKHQHEEYLSQGLLEHRGRSCVFSLKTLEDCGLYSLYPKFATPNETLSWRKFSLSKRPLRFGPLDNWSRRQATTSQEVQIAHEMGRTCFMDHNPIAMTLMLLCFKNRTHIPVSVTEFEGSWGQTPQEVKQYLLATKKLLDILHASPSGSEKVVELLRRTFMVD